MYEEEHIVTCPRCSATVPDVAHFCQRCGQDQRSTDGGRRQRFAVKPDEPVASFALMSTIMPRGVTERPTTYRLALAVALAIALVAAIFGALPIAILVAVVAIPLVYIVYLYDVNLWDDQPVRVTALAFGATFVVALLFTVLWTQFTPLNTGLGGFRLGPLLVYALLVPVVGEVIRQVGPVLLASRPQFDDLMDGLTFGVVSGVAYSAAETLVLYWPTLLGGRTSTHDAGTWVALIFLQGFVKPLVLGTASGIAAAEFSGLGRGYDGFTRRYLRGFLQAAGAVIAFYLGMYLLGRITDVTVSAFLSVGWGLVLLGILIILVRSVLHTALLEAALESAAREGGVGQQGELEFCAQCEMPLLDGASFCTACGAAVRVQHAKPKRVPATVGAPAGPAAPDGQAAPAGEAPTHPSPPHPSAMPSVPAPPAPAHQAPPPADQAPPPADQAPPPADQAPPPADQAPVVPPTASAGSPVAPQPDVSPPEAPKDRLDEGDWSDGDSGEHPDRWESSPVADAQVADAPAEAAGTGPADEQTGPADQQTGPADQQTGPADQQTGPADDQTGPTDEEKGAQQ